MSLQARTEGGPSQKFYESAETLQQFEFIKQWLVKQCKKYTQAEPPLAKSLAQLTVQMWQFQVCAAFLDVHVLSSSFACGANRTEIALGAPTPVFVNREPLNTFRFPLTAFDSLVHRKIRWGRTRPNLGRSPVCQFAFLWICGPEARCATFLLPLTSSRPNRDGGGNYQLATDRTVDSLLEYLALLSRYRRIIAHRPRVVT